MNSFSVLSIFFLVKWLLRLVECFISVIIFTNLSLLLSSVFSGSVNFRFPVFFGVLIYMPPRSVLSFYNFDILILELNFCGSNSNLVRRSICKFDLLASLPALFRIVRYVLICVRALLWCLNHGFILGLPVWHYFCLFGNMCFPVSFPLVSVHLSPLFSAVCLVIFCRWMMLYILILVIQCRNLENRSLFRIRLVSPKCLPVPPYLFVLPKQNLLSCICFFSVGKICCLFCLVFLL